MEIWLIFILAGLLAGFFAGLLGIGGGFVVVPILMFTLPQVGIPVEQTAHFAIGTSLLCICVTAFFSTRAHHSKQAIDWTLFKLIAPMLIIGTLLGTVTAAILAGNLLIIFFIIGAISTAVYLLSGHKPRPSKHKKTLPMILYGVFTGCISSLIGIGGGSLLAPFLVYRGKPMVNAVATAAACGIPIAIFGTLGYAISGLQANLNVQYAIGYLYLPAFLGIALFSSLSASWGAKVAHCVSEKRLKQLFAAFLIFSSSQILYSHWF